MPEAPELALASKLVNTVCKSLAFGGKIVKSDVSRQPDIEWLSESYRICSKARGKEIMLTLTEVVETKRKPKTTSILFHFGMSGFFKLTPAEDIPKHSHLRFFTMKENPQMVLNFIDTRRFGGWEETSDWSKDRGPDPITEYQLFRENVLNNLNNAAFKKPICEVMLNQKYFNGIGNYLRAEILYRAEIKPFEEASQVLEPLVTADMKIKREVPDILQLCRDVPTEVIALGVASSYDSTAGKEEMRPFIEWIRCYDKPGMKNIRDHNKRTMWFSGEPGPLVPKGDTTKNKRKKSEKTGKLEDRENMDFKSNFKEPSIPREVVSKRTTRSRVKAPVSKD